MSNQTCEEWYRGESSPNAKVKPAIQRAYDAGVASQQKRIDELEKELLMEQECSSRNSINACDQIHEMSQQMEALKAFIHKTQYGRSGEAFKEAQQLLGYNLGVTEKVDY